ncbi:MAG: hypothetical protein AAFY02_16405 [Pseudomonadota bacterium]
MNKLATALVFLLFSTGAAVADRPATPEERAQVEAALAEIGCTATDIEWDESDRRFEVDNARCGNQGRFDFELDRNYVIVDGERPVTAQEREQIDAALAKEGCSGGRAEWDYDDNRFEIDDAICADNQRFEFRLDKDFGLIRMKRD